MQARRRDQAQVLHVALTPAAVAAQIAGQRLGRVFKAGRRFGQHPNPPTRAAQKGGLDEIMAEDDTAARRATRQMRQTCAGGKGAGADQGVVAQKIALGPCPEGKAAAEVGAVNLGGEGLQALPERVSGQHAGHGLDQAEAGVCGEGICHPQNGVRAHQAVGIQDQHRIMAMARSADPIADIAGFVIGVPGPVAVVQGQMRVPLAGGVKGGGLLPDVGRVAGV